MSKANPFRSLDVLKADFEKEGIESFIEFYKYATRVRVVYCTNFLLEAWEFKTLPGFMREAKYKEIVASYVSESAKQKINITPKVRAGILERGSPGKITVFDKAAELICHRIEKEVYTQFRAEFKSSNVVKARREIFPILQENCKPEVISAAIFLFTDEKADLKIHKLNNEAMLKKWLIQGTHLIEILWATLCEDLDPEIMVPFFEVLTDSGLHQILDKAINVGTSNSHMLSEFEEPETVLKEYLMSIEPDWWTKVLKKNMESIYKNSFKEVEEINQELSDKAFVCIKGVILSVCNPKEPLPPRFQNLLFSLNTQISKNHPEVDATQRGLAVVKLLIDAACAVICAPSKSLFDLKINGSISRTNFAMLVSDCLKSLLDPEDENLTKTSEVNNLIRQCRKHLTSNVIAQAEAIARTGTVAYVARQPDHNDLNVSQIGRYFASNAPFLLQNYTSDQLVCLHMFLMDNLKADGTRIVDTESEENSMDSTISRPFNSSDASTTSKNRSVSKFVEQRSLKSSTVTGMKLNGRSTMMQRSDSHGQMAQSSRGNTGKFGPETPIGDLLRHIVKDQLKLQMDPSNLVKTMQDDCIFTLGHLQLLPPQELYNIRLPTLIRYVLANQYCNPNLQPIMGGGGGSFVSGGVAPTNSSFLNLSSNEIGLGDLSTPAPTSNVFKGTFDDSASESADEKNSFLNLANDERMAIRKSWMLLAELIKDKAKVDTPTGPQLVSDIFYSTFWEQFLRTDVAARNMFQFRSMKDKEVHLNRILGHSMAILDQTSMARQKIAQLGVQHCIWDIQQCSFDAMSLSFSSALFKALGTNADDDTCNAWFNFLTSVSSLISDRYDRVKAGYRGEIFHKHGSEWRKKGFLLTHEALYLFKSPEALAQGKKPKFSLLFAHATDFDTEETDQKIDKITPYCFSIIFGTVIKYFCVKSSEDFKEWVDNITWRIKAYHRVREANEKEGTKYLTSAEMKKGMIKDNKQKLSKTEKAAQRVLRYRKHIDTQIKTEADFQIFDKLVQATIIIDTKGNIVYLNEAVSKLFEIPETDMKGKNIKLFMPSNHAAQHDSYLNNYITTGKKKIIGEGRDVAIKSKSGEKMVNLTVVDHQQTGVRFFIGTLVPASAQDTSSGSEGNYRQDFSIFDRMIQPTIAITKEGIIDYVNDALASLTSYAKTEMVGKNVTMLMNDHDAAQHDKILQNYLRTGVKKIIGTPGRPVTLKDKNGDKMRCLLTVTEHFQGSQPFFMGTVAKDNDLASSEGSINSEGVSESQFALFDNLLDTTISINSTGVILYCNTATKDLTGFTPLELVNKNITYLMNPTYARKHDGYLKNYQKTGIKSIIGRGREVPIVVKAGHEVKVFLTVTEHEISGTSCFIGTLTTKKDEFTLYDNLLDATIVINEQGIIQYSNNAIKKLLEYNLVGYNPQSLIGKNVKMLMPKEYADKHDKFLKNYLTTGKKKIIGTGRTLPFVTRNKTVVSGFLSVVESNLGGKRIFVGTMTLKTSHDEAEEKLLLQATKLILCDLANPAIVISKRGLIKVFNNSAEKMLGYKEPDMLNKNIKMLMPEEFAVRHDDILKNYLKTGKSSIIGVGRFLPFIALDGEIIKLHLTLSEKKDKEGKSIYFIGILTKMNELGTNNNSS